MKQVLQDLGKGRIFVDEVPPGKPGPGQVLVRNAYSALSPGTEKSKVEIGRKSLLGKALERPDQVRLVLHKIRQEGLLSTWQKVKDRLDRPTPLGYSSSGVVIETGCDVEKLKVGDRVACAGNQFATHAEIITVPVNLCVKVPEGVHLSEAATATLGAIALHGVRQSKTKLGENVVVIGLGLLGQLTTQILRAGGCRVFGIDLEPNKVELARALGMEEGGLWDTTGLPERIHSFTNGLGADAVLLTAATESSEPLLFAAHCARDRARLVVLGLVPVSLPRSPFYEKELSVVSSRSYGPGRYDPLYEEKGVDYPIGYVRWTEGRNMSAYLNLLSRRTINIKPLLTHHFSIEEAPQAFERIASPGEETTLAVLLEYPQEIQAPLKTLKIKEPSAPHTGTVGLGVIGAGNFGSSTILPTLKEMKEIDLRILCTQHGHSAAHLGRKLGFLESTCDPEMVLKNPAVDTVLIATRHNTHGPLVKAALEAGKRVFVEKPLCLNTDELDQIIKAHALSNRPVMVGFNRRFSRLIKEARTFLSGLARPRLINYRINAGPLPPGHWLKDTEVGGGRILGEVCHFIDLAVHLADSQPTQLSAQSPGGPASEDVSVQITFKDESLANIFYTSQGHAGFGKERLEVFASQHVLVLDDFRSLMIHGPTIKKRFKTWTPNKGYREELEAWVRSLLTGEAAPIPLCESILTTQLTFMVLESLEKGRPLPIQNHPTQ